MKKTGGRVTLAVMAVIIIRSITFAQEDVSEPEFLYSQDSRGITLYADASSATIRGENGMLITYLSGYRATYRIVGTKESPWNQIDPLPYILHYDQSTPSNSFFNTFNTDNRKRTAEYIVDGKTAEYEEIVDAGYNLSIYLMNVMTTDVDQELIGFFHSEYLQAPTYDHNGNRQWGLNTYPAVYAISIGYSSNNGRNWEFCGDIIQTNDQTKGTDRNIGGAAYIIVENNIYLYYSEAVASPFSRYNSVAKAEKYQVITAARAGTVTEWKKWTGGTTWNGSACGEVRNSAGQNPTPPDIGNQVIFNSVFGGTITNNDFFDMHGDATFCQANGFYYLSSHIHQKGLYLLRSKDGLNWGLVSEISKGSLVTVANPKFPYFVSISGESDDFRNVGKSFYVYFMDYRYNNDDTQDPRDLWRVRIDAHSHTQSTNLLFD